MHATVRPLPRLLSLPARLVPDLAHSAALSLLLNRLLAARIADGELDFLAGKVMHIRVEDLGTSYRLGLRRRQLVPIERQHRVDAVIAGNAYEFLVLALRREDPDTLFFQRRLRMEGDTEIGLQVKNFLDSLELPLPDLPAPLREAGERALRWYEQRMSASG